MTDKTADFRARLQAARPDVVERQDKNARKREIAIKLRKLRDSRGMTQAQVADAAGMTQPEIARMEALTGPDPRLGTIDKYVHACGGHWDIEISPDAIDESSEPEHA